MAGIAAALPLVLAWLVLAPPTSACSCGPATLADFAAQPETVIAVGSLGPDGPGGPTFLVSEMLVGPANPVLTVRPESFGDSAGCGIPRPQLGEPIFAVGWLGEDGRVGFGLCSPFVPLSSQDGQNLLAEARTIVAAASPTAASPATTSPAPEAPTSTPTLSSIAPAPTAEGGTADPTAAGIDPASAILAATLAGSLGIFGALSLAARRRRPG